jgi:hypothetical protein
MDGISTIAASANMEAKANRTQLDTIEKEIGTLCSEVKQPALSR